MNIALIWFVCDKDLPFFKESFKSVERLRKMMPDDNITTYVSMEKKDNNEFHCADRWFISEYGRQGALRGRECFEEILNVYSVAFETDRNDVIVKVDADTIINDLNWLHEIDLDNVGFLSTTRNEYFSFGGTYTLTPLGLKYINLLWRRVDIRGRAFNLDDYKENILIHRLIRFGGGVSYASILSDNNIDNTGYCVYEDFIWKGEKAKEHVYPPYEKLAKHYAVTFRSSWNKTSGESNRALTRMKNFNRWMEENEKD